jgi:hypothetical protein
VRRFLRASSTSGRPWTLLWEHHVIAVERGSATRFPCAAPAYPAHTPGTALCKLRPMAMPRGVGRAVSARVVRGAAQGPGQAHATGNVDQLADGLRGSVLPVRQLLQAIYCHSALCS